MRHDVSTLPLLVEIAIESKSRYDHETLIAALMQLAVEDGSLVVSVDQDSTQIVVKGTSEDHIESMIGALNRTSGIEVNIGAPQVAFPEHPTKWAEAEYIHKRIFGARGDFAAVRLAIEPSEFGKGYEFECKIGNDAVPNEYMPGIKKGIESARACAQLPASQWSTSRSN